MTRLLARALVSSLAAAAAAGAGCGETQDPIPERLGFDRPTDMTFACYGGLRITNGAPADPTQEVTVSAMPTHGCDIYSGAVAGGTVPPGQEELSGGALLGAVNWRGFVLQSGPGTLSLVSFPTGPLSALGLAAGGSVTPVDADPLTPGPFNSFSVGEDPVAIATDRDGCHVMTANAGSCDLSVVDVNSVFDSNPLVGIQRLKVTNSSGAPIGARPAAMVAEPSSQEIGKACPATPTGLVYVAYPSCHLVAGVDAATGAMVTAIQYDAAGVPSIVAPDVTCPDECSGGIPSAGVRPVSLDLLVDPRSGSRRLAIGADNSSSIAIVDLDAMTRPLSVFQIALEDPRGDLGVTQVALSPEIGMGGKSLDHTVVDDGAPGGDFQFVYAVATDHAVRVADVLNVRSECDTQVDPRFARDVTSAPRLACFPVGDATNPPRRPGARGPGISLPNGEIPFSVSISRQQPRCKSDSDQEAPQCTESPGLLVGYFAMISASSGLTYVANVDDDDYEDRFSAAAPLGVSMALALPHQLRDGIPNRSKTVDDVADATCDTTGENTQPANGPRAIAPPARSVPSGAVAAEKLIQLPGVRQLACVREAPAESKAVSELSFVVPPAVRDAEFPDLAAVRSETWTLAWEGLLSNNRGADNVGGPAVRESMMFVDGGGIHLRDQGKPFCAAGVEPYDIVQLRGCDPSIGNADCPVGYTCFVHPESQVSGLGACMLADEANRLATACKSFLTTARRYTVKTTESGELRLLPRRFELRTTPLDGCTDDAQCRSLANYALLAGRGTHPADDANNPNLPVDTHSWACVADPNRAPLGGTGKRCQMTCSTVPNPTQPGAPAYSSDCASGTICIGATEGLAGSGFCMESVTPPQACVNAPQRYELRAGEAFAVLGNRSGFLHPIIENAAGQCVKDPMASPLLTGRLPLQPKDPLAPDTLRACDPAADPVTGKLPNGMFEPNPCSTTVAQTDVQPQYVPGTCSLPTDPNQPKSLLVERQAPAVRFRNRSMNLTIVDPYYPGDATCITDRGANLGKIPHVVPGYVLSFGVVGGFSPLVLTDQTTLPTRVVRGPLGSTWVMDTGDFLSTSSGVASARGAVYVYDGLRRINILR